MSNANEQQQARSESERSWWSSLRVFGRRHEKMEPHGQDPVLARGIASDVMVVLQFRPAWEIQAYLRFARLPYRVENSRYPGSASTGLYPALLDGQFMLPGAEASHHVAKMRRDLDQNLTREEKAEARAFILLVRERLQPLLRIIRYRAGGSAVRQTVHPAMKSTLPWPLTWWSPSAEERRIGKEALARGFAGLTKAKLLEQARGLFSALDLRLGGQDAYFFGATPTSLDACVFGHLAEAWSVGDLLDILPAFENLSRFFRHVCDHHFRPGSSPPIPFDSDGYASDGVSEAKGDSGLRGAGVPSLGGEGGVGVTRASDRALTEAVMRADYLNSLNAFNQLSGCALCAEAPYAGDPYPERSPPNVGIPPPALAGRNPRAAVPVNENDGHVHGELSSESSWLWTTGVGIVAYMLYGVFSNLEFTFGSDGEETEEGETEEEDH